MILKILNETPSKCNHIILDTDIGIITTTKPELLSPSTIIGNTQEETDFLNQVREQILKTGETNWTNIKLIIEPVKEILETA